MSDPKLPPYSKFCKCAACGEYFTTERNFNMHRRGSPRTRVCVDPGTVVNKKGKARLRLNAKGYWAKTGGVYLGPEV